MELSFVDSLSLLCISLSIISFLAYRLGSISSSSFERLQNTLETIEYTIRHIDQRLTQIEKNTTNDDTKDDKICHDNDNHDTDGEERDSVDALLETTVNKQKETVEDKIESLQTKQEEAVKQLQKTKNEVTPEKPSDYSEEDNSKDNEHGNTVHQAASSVILPSPFTEDKYKVHFNGEVESNGSLIKNNKQIWLSTQDGYKNFHNYRWSLWYEACIAPLPLGLKIVQIDDQNPPFDNPASHLKVKNRKIPAKSDSKQLKRVSFEALADIYDRNPLGMDYSDKKDFIYCLNGEQEDLRSLQHHLEKFIQSDFYSLDKPEDFRPLEDEEEFIEIEGEEDFALD